MRIPYILSEWSILEKKLNKHIDTQEQKIEKEIKKRERGDYPKGFGDSVRRIFTMLLVGIGGPSCMLGGMIYLTDRYGGIGVIISFFLLIGIPLMFYIFPLISDKYKKDAIRTMRKSLETIHEHLLHIEKLGRKLKQSEGDYLMYADQMRTLYPVITDDISNIAEHIRYILRRIKKIRGGETEELIVSWISLVTDYIREILHAWLENALDILHGQYRSIEEVGDTGLTQISKMSIENMIYEFDTIRKELGVVESLENSKIRI